MREAGRSRSWAVASILGALLLVLLHPARTDAAEDRYFEALVELETPKKKPDRTEGGLEHAPFRLWLPGGSRTVRGVLLNPFYTKAVTQKHWQAACRQWRFGILAANLFAVRQAEFPRLIDAALATFAAQSAHPELAGAKLSLVGMSAGAGMSVNIAKWMPDRVVAVGPVCLEVGPRNEESMEIPMLTVFGERDGKQYEKLMARLPAARRQSGRFAIAVQWRRKHEFAGANNLLFPLFDAAIRARLDAPGRPLRSLDEQVGWLGDVSTWRDRVPAIASVTSYPGEKNAACWFPDETTARAWQGFVTREPRLELTQPPGLGDGQPFVLHRAGERIRVEGRWKGEEASGAIEVYAGDRRLGRLDSGQLDVRFEKPGIYPLVLRARCGDGSLAVSRPNTIVVATRLVAEETLADRQPAWPQANGPYGNFCPRQFRAELIDDLAGAKLAWISEEKDLGYAKGSVSGYLQNLARWDGHPGSCCGPIVAEGKVFVTTFRPSGEPRAENQPGLEDVARWKKPVTEEQRARLRANLRILADDLLVAIDQETGQTAWKAVEADKGLNRYMGKRQGFCVSPAYHDGVVFSMGTTGRLYAYRGATGEKIWETDIGTAHEAALDHRTSVLERKVLAGGMGWDSSLTTADGVLIVPLFEGRADLGLRGVNVETGRTIWNVAEACSRHATPALWSHEDRQYMLTATVAGTLRLIDPHSGRTLWRVDGLGPNHFSLSPSAGYVTVNGGSSTPRRPGSTQRYGLLAGYRLRPDGATLAWKHPDDPELYFSTWMDSCARRFLAVREGRVYFRSHGVARAEGRLYVLDEATGKVLARRRLVSPAPHFYLVEDRLLMIRDASHSETELAFFRAGSKDLEQLSDFWLPPHQNTTAYEVLMEHPYAGGRLFLRTKDGRIACYDLRK